MFIESIKIDITGASGRKYGRFISFQEKDGTVREINLIYGKNTLGKSTLIESIVYALSGEEIYGKKKNDVANYSLIMSKYKEDFLKESYVLLQLINNNKERVVIKRNCIDRNDSIIVYRNTTIEKLKSASSIEYYKASKDKGIQGNRTFQDFLFEYFQLPIYTSSNEDENDKNITMIFYIQNLLPLFMIHQHAWNDIQANNPQYGIKDIKNVAFEYILNFTTVKYMSEKFILSQKQNLLKIKINSLKDVEDIVATITHTNTAHIDIAIIKLEDEIVNLKTELNEMEGGG